MAEILWVTLAIGLVIVAAGIAAWRQGHARSAAADRLQVAEEDPAPRALVPQRPFAVRHRLLPWLLGGGTGLLLHEAFALRPIFSGAGCAIVVVLVSMLDKMRFERGNARIETQLADAIDLMVGALRAGAGLLDAFAAATEESPSPLKEQLLELTAKIRLGEDPRRALRELTERVPLQSFDLFVLTVGANWEVGGSLAPGLTTVGKTIRDRIDVARRVQALSTQSRVSVIAILGVSYFIGLLMWRTDPRRMQEFIASDLGSAAVGLTLILQAFGIVWINAMAEIEH